MAQKQERFYQLLIAFFDDYDGKLAWDVHQTGFGKQVEAYQAMAEYRDYYSDKETPLRIVRIDVGKLDGDLNDVTFIDETGMSVAAWTEMARVECEDMLCLEEDDPC